MIKVTRHIYNPETTTTTVSLSTPQGEITKTVRCSNEDQERGYLNKAAGKAIATQKCLIEYYRRKAKMLSERLKEQIMVKEVLFHRLFTNIEWNDDHEEVIRVVNWMVRNTQKQFDEAKNMYEKSQNDFRDMAALLQAYYYFYGE